jgi:nucleoside 2-deoxyribosyltransferase
MSKSVYLAGPITGLTYDDARFGWRKEFGERMTEHGVTVLSPMRHEGHLAEVKGPLDKDYPSHIFSHGKMIVAKDFLDIDVSAIVVANFMGAKKASLGTVAEIGYAAAKGKTIVVIRDKDDAIHNHPFINEPAAVVVDNLEDAIAITGSLLSEGV